MLQLFIRHKSIFSDFFEIDSRMQIFVVENAIEFFFSRGLCIVQHDSATCIMRNQEAFKQSGRKQN